MPVVQTQSKIEKRSPLLVAALSILTFGIYFFYWLYKTKNEMNSLGGKIPSVWISILSAFGVYMLLASAQSLDLTEFFSKFFSNPFSVNPFSLILVFSMFASPFVSAYWTYRYARAFSDYVSKGTPKILFFVMLLFFFPFATYYVQKRLNEMT